MHSSVAVPDFNRREYMTSYVPICAGLNVQPWRGQYGPGDQYLLHGASHVAATNMEPPPGAIWLPSLFDWLELLELAGHAGISFENVGEMGWHVYPIGNRDDFGSGITREIAAARLWKKIRT
jgi:hypothetical protein